MMRVVMVLIALLVPAAASAQDQARVYKGLEVDALPTAYVLDDKGVETKGRLLNLDPAAVTLLIDGSERRFEMANVRRVSRRGDSLKNGAIAGAVAGVLLGIFGAAISDCPGYGDDGCAGIRVAMVGFSTAFYTGVGVGIDAAYQGRTVMYQAAPPTTAHRGTAVAFRLSW